MIETIEDGSPKIAVIVLQYAFIDIQTIFIPDLIVNHSAPLKPGPRFTVVALR
jgi:hypothetical protein